MIDVSTGSGLLSRGARRLKTTSVFSTAEARAWRRIPVEEAVRWYRKAAEQGFALAQSNLGNAYRKGEGVAKDPFEAVRWYRKAAEQGLAQAQFNLGSSYYNGEGVAKDLAEAVRWYRKAAELGHPNAQRAGTEALREIEATERQSRLRHDPADVPQKEEGRAELPNAPKELAGMDEVSLEHALTKALKLKRHPDLDSVRRANNAWAGGTKAFGRSPSTPIPVIGVTGAILYLSYLTTLRGQEGTFSPARIGLRPRQYALHLRACGSRWVVLGLSSFLIPTLKHRLPSRPPAMPW